MRTMCSREIFTKKCRQQQIFDSDLKGAWHYNHVTFTPIAKNFMLYCRLIYRLSILCVRLTIKVKVGIPESFKVGWYPPKNLGRVTLRVKSLSSAPYSSHFTRVIAPTVRILGAITICTEISVKNFRQMVLVFFLAPKAETGLSCTIYKISVNFSLSLDLKPGPRNPNKWYKCFGKNGKKVIP